MRASQTRLSRRSLWSNRRRGVRRGRRSLQAKRQRRSGGVIVRLVVRSIRESSIVWESAPLWTAFAGVVVWQFVSGMLTSGSTAVVAGFAGLAAGAIFTVVALSWVVVRWRKGHPSEPPARPFTRRAVRQAEHEREQRGASRKWGVIGSLTAGAGVVVAEGPPVIHNGGLGFGAAFLLLAPPAMWWLTRPR